MNRTTILIIDDEPSNTQAIIEILKRAAFEYRMLSASTGSLGYEIAFSVRPDIILTDWCMPDIDGIQLIKKLKNEPLTKDIPIIMVTGVNMTSIDLKTALDSGALDYIRKPIDEHELIARINSALSLIDYYKQKIKAENYSLELALKQAQILNENKRSELVLSSTKLFTIKKLYDEFAEKIDSESCNGCVLCEKAKYHTHEMIKYTNQQIWNDLELHLEQLNNQYIKRLAEKYPTLSNNEKLLCGYLMLNFSTKEIASITRHTIRSVEIARTRLREKLGLKGSSEDIFEFLKRL